MSSAAADAEDNAAAADLLASIDRRLSSLQEWSLVELAQCRGPLSLHAELAGQVNSDLAVVDGLVEDLALLAEQHSSPRRRSDIIEQCSQRSMQLERLRGKVRDATLASRRRIQAASASSMRSELFSSSKSSAQSRPSKAETHASKDDELMSATSNVTDGLRRTRQLMEQELERSVLSTQMLERSSQTLTLTSNQYTSFSDILSTSKKLITALEKADVLDRLLITAALIFFFLVCILIIKRRIIDRGVRAVSLVGKIAGGVGGVANRGAKAILPREASSQLKDSVSSLAQAVTTALASATTAVASVSTTSLLSTSTPPAKAASVSTSTLYDSLTMDAAEAINVADTSLVPVVIETEQAGFAISTSSEAEPLHSTATSTSEELALDEFEQAEASDLSDAIVADHFVSNDEAQDIHVDTVSIPNPTATVVVSEDAPLALSLDEEPSVPADSAQAPDLELDPLGERLTHLDQANSDVHEVRHQLDDEHIEGGSSALSNHDEL